MLHESTHQDEENFEREVIEIAIKLWGKSDPFQGSTMVDGKERDAVLIEDERITIIEATVSRRLDKAQKDGKKIRDLCKEMMRKYPYKAVRGYFVTRDEPTAEQRDFISGLEGVKVSAVSYNQIRKLLIDSPEYLSRRATYSFGSARNLITGTSQNLEDYIPMGLLEDPRGKPRIHEVSDVARSLGAGNSVILVGDFGAGKSMTTRAIHDVLVNEHLSNRSKRFPLTLNLRDHQSQTDPEEAIHRHCRLVGFADSSNLVRAWRAGEVIVLLDGFDEIATSGWLGKTKGLKNIRHRSVELIRKFAENTPAKSGIFVTGRRHLFDNSEEMKDALGLSVREPTILFADEFSNDQVQKYLKNHGWEGELPEWLPARPLLLGVLASKHSIDGLVEMSQVTPAEGWDTLLDSICERESKMEIGLNSETVRLIVERLATIARASVDGIGPIYEGDMARAFEEVCGYAPDEGAHLVIQRLPGLGVLDPNDGSRHFIDNDLVDAARAGDIVRLVTQEDVTPFSAFASGVTPMGVLGQSLGELKFTDKGMTANQVAGKAPQLNSQDMTSAIILDLVQIALRMGPKTSLPSIYIDDIGIESLILGDEQCDLDSVKIRKSTIGTLDLSEFGGDYNLPIFIECDFGLIKGIGGPDALPDSNFIKCHHPAFDAASKTISGIMSMPGLSDRQKVMLSVLKKVYMQAGGTRRENALGRGLGQKQARLVEEVVEYLVSENVLIKSRGGGHNLYSSTRKHAQRVRKMIESGASSDDSLLGNVS